MITEALVRVEGDKAVLIPYASAMLAEFERQVNEIQAKQDELKKRILAEMEANGIISIETDELSITYVASYTKESFNKKAFRKVNPDLYDEYVQITTVSPSVRIKVKGDGGK